MFGHVDLHEFPDVLVDGSVAIQIRQLFHTLARRQKLDHGRLAFSNQVFVRPLQKLELF